jgi:nucleoside-diphosphate-sugar epimerase
MPFKALDATELQALGWRPGVAFHDGLDRTYRWFLNHEAQLAQR